jgi:hypothetical protein
MAPPPTPDRRGIFQTLHLIFSEGRFPLSAIRHSHFDRSDRSHLSSELRRFTLPHLYLSRPTARGTKTDREGGRSTCKLQVDGPMGRRHEPLGQSYCVEDAINLMEVDRFRQVWFFCRVRFASASCTLPVPVHSSLFPRLSTPPQPSQRAFCNTPNSRLDHANSRF